MPFGHSTDFIQIWQIVIQWLLCCQVAIQTQSQTQTEPEVFRKHSNLKICSYIGVTTNLLYRSRTLGIFSQNNDNKQMFKLLYGNMKRIQFSWKCENLYISLDFSWQQWSVNQNCFLFSFPMSILNLPWKTWRMEILEEILGAIPVTKFSQCFKWSLDCFCLSHRLSIDEILFTNKCSGFSS